MSEQLLILPPNYSKRIFYVSFLTLVSVYVSYTQELYDHVIVGSLVLTSSLNYWRYPIKGPRRSMDILIAFSGCFYQLYKSFIYQLHMLYILCTICAIGCYYQARMSSNQHSSSWWHCGIHIFGNMGNLLLYNGINNLNNRS